MTKSDAYELDIMLVSLAIEMSVSLDNPAMDRTRSLSTDGYHFKFAVVVLACSFLQQYMNKLVLN